MPGELSGMGLLLPLLLGLLLFTLRLSRRPVQSKGWQLLRCLLPSWRFFEDVEPGPELSFRVLPAGDWLPAVVPATTRGFWLNARGNLSLAEQSLAEQLLSELDGVEASHAPRLVSYQLVQRLVEARLREEGLASVPARYVFRLRFEAPNGSAYESEEHAFE
jgi:hypothetical protein